MFIAVRKENNGSIYINKDIVSSSGLSEIELSRPPYNYTIVSIGDTYKDCISVDFDYDLKFNIEKYNSRKIKEKNEAYEELIVSKIRQRYNINQELAILRQRDTKPQEYEAYNAYVEQCKAEAKVSIYKGE